MPGYNFAWTNFPPGLLRELARYLGLDLADPAVALRQRYGARPTEDFIRLARPVLERTWLARDPTALAAVVKSLWRPTTRDGYLVPSGRQRQLDWLASRKSTVRLCGVLLDQFTASGERTTEGMLLSAPDKPDVGGVTPRPAPGGEPRQLVTHSRHVKEAVQVASRGQPKSRVTVMPAA
jgi:hypothetical protein